MKVPQWVIFGIVNISVKGEMTMPNVAKKGVIGEDEFGNLYVKCPSCDGIINFLSDCIEDKKYQDNYCMYCGQRLLWDEDEKVN